MISEKKRQTILKYVSSGHSPEEAAELYSVTARTIYRWRKLLGEGEKVLPEPTVLELVPREPTKEPEPSYDRFVYGDDEKKEPEKDPARTPTPQELEEIMMSIPHKPVEAPTPVAAPAFTFKPLDEVLAACVRHRKEIVRILCEAGVDYKTTMLVYDLLGRNAQERIVPIVGEAFRAMPAGEPSGLAGGNAGC